MFGFTLHMSDDALDGLSDNERRRIEHARREAEYRASPHPKRWARRERFELERFRQSVAETKPIFDCLSMAMTSAAFFGAACYVLLSQPMNELCERQGWVHFPVFALAIWLAVTAFGPAVLMLRYMFSTPGSSALAPYQLGKRNRDDFMLHAAVLAGLVAMFSTASVIADQVASRAPYLECVGPMP